MNLPVPQKTLEQNLYNISTLELRQTFPGVVDEELYHLGTFGSKNKSFMEKNLAVNGQKSAREVEKAAKEMPHDKKTGQETNTRSDPFVRHPGRNLSLILLLPAHLP